MTQTLLTLGAGPGIGLATAKRFADAGFELSLGARKPGRLQEQVRKLYGKQFKATYVAVEAGVASQVAELVARTHADVLHDNTSVPRYAPMVRSRRNRSRASRLTTSSQTSS